MDYPKRVAGTGSFPVNDPPKWDRKPEQWNEPRIPVSVWLTGGIIVLFLINRR